MKTIQKLFVLSLFVAGSVIMVSGCGDAAKKDAEKPAAKTDTDAGSGEKATAEKPENASTTPAVDGLTKVVFSVSGMS